MEIIAVIEVDVLKEEVLARQLSLDVVGVYESQEQLG